MLAVVALNSYDVFVAYANVGKVYAKTQVSTEHVLSECRLASWLLLVQRACAETLVV